MWNFPNLFPTANFWMQYCGECVFSDKTCSGVLQRGCISNGRNSSLRVPNYKNQIGQNDGIDFFLQSESFANTVLARRNDEAIQKIAKAGLLRRSSSQGRLCKKSALIRLIRVIRVLNSMNHRDGFSQMRFDIFALFVKKFRLENFIR